MKKLTSSKSDLSILFLMRQIVRTRYVSRCGIKKITQTNV